MGWEINTILEAMRRDLIAARMSTFQNFVRSLNSKRTPRRHKRI